MQVSFSGFAIPIAHNRFSFAYSHLDQALQWKGSFDTPTLVTGTVQTALPGLTTKVHAELCPSGLQTFSARPTAATGRAGRPLREDLTLVVTRDLTGAVHIATTAR